MLLTMRSTSIECEGNHGELLKITTKHTILAPDDLPNPDPSQFSDTSHTLPPVDALLPLTLQMRTDRKLATLKELEASGLFTTIVSFLSTYGTKLRIKAALDVERDQAQFQVPLLLQPFPSPLRQNFGAAVNRLESLALSFNYYTPSNSDISPAHSQNRLILKRPDAPSTSLIFRAMLKCFSRLVIRYPLVFDARWLEHLQEQSAYLPSIAKSMSRLARKVQSDEKCSILGKCLTRLGRNPIVSSEAAGVAAASAETMAHIEAPLQADSDLFQAEIDGCLKTSFFSLLMHATKRRHAITKLVLPPLEDALATAETNLVNPQMAEAYQDTRHVDTQASESADFDSASSNILRHEQSIQLGGFTPANKVDGTTSIQDFLFTDIQEANPEVALYETPLPLVTSASPSDSAYADMQLDIAVQYDEIDWGLPVQSSGSHDSVTLDDFKYSVGQLQALTDQGTSHYSDLLGENLDGQHHQEHLAKEDEDMSLDDSTTLSDAFTYSPLDNQYLDQIDAKLAHLAEEAELYSINQSMMKLYKV